jgi:hypothetical protein
MRRTITLMAATVAVAAGITSSASAATLYTNAAHTTPVAVGTTFSATGTNWFLWSSPSTPFVVCPGENLDSFTVTQNSGGVFKANLTNQILRNCNAPSVGGKPGVGGLQISGSPIAVGSSKAWLATTLTGSLSTPAGTWTENFSSATGNPPTGGVYAQQPATGASPVSIVLDHAASVTGPGITTPYTVSETYTISGTSYSLG